eukprot:7223859-Prorocentrum_lima.AAC.1
MACGFYLYYSVPTPLQDVPSVLWDDLYYSTTPQQIPSALWSLNAHTSLELCGFIIHHIT